MAKSDQTKPTSPAALPTERFSLFRAFLNMIAEFRRVTWPTPGNALRLTIFVLILSAVLGVFFGLAIDNLFSRIVTFIGGS